MTKKERALVDRLLNTAARHAAREHDEIRRRGVPNADAAATRDRQLLKILNQWLGPSIVVPAVHRSRGSLGAVRETVSRRGQLISEVFAMAGSAEDLSRRYWERVIDLKSEVTANLDEITATGGVRPLDRVAPAKTPSAADATGWKLDSRDRPMPAFFPNVLEAALGAVENGAEPSDVHAVLLDTLVRGEGGAFREVSDEALRSGDPKLLPRNFAWAAIDLADRLRLDLGDLLDDYRIWRGQVRDLLLDDPERLLRKMVALWRQINDASNQLSQDVAGAHAADEINERNPQELRTGSMTAEEISAALEGKAGLDPEAIREVAREALDRARNLQEEREQGAEETAVPDTQQAHAGSSESKSTIVEFEPGGDSGEGKCVGSKVGNAPHLFSSPSVGPCQPEAGHGVALDPCGPGPVGVGQLTRLGADGSCTAPRLGIPRGASCISPGQFSAPSEGINAMSPLCHETSATPQSLVPCPSEQATGAAAATAACVVGELLESRPPAVPEQDQGAPLPDEQLPGPPQDPPAVVQLLTVVDTARPERRRRTEEEPEESADELMIGQPLVDLASTNEGEQAVHADLDEEPSEAIEVPVHAQAPNFTAGLAALGENINGEADVTGTPDLICAARCASAVVPADENALPERSQVEVHLEEFEDNDLINSLTDAVTDSLGRPREVHIGPATAKLLD